MTLPLSVSAKAKSKPLAWTPTFLRWCKFNLVGAVGILVQFALLFFLKSELHVHYLAATALAVEAAVLHNFVWHERFTWADRTTPDRTKPDGITPDNIPPARHKLLARFLRFNFTTGLVSIVGNLGLMRVLVGLGHMDYLVANGIAIAVCSLANFLVSDGWVFAK